MGGFFPFCGCGTAPEQELTQVMRHGIKYTNIELAQGEDDEVNNLIANKKNYQIKLTDCTVQFQLMEQKSKEEMPRIVEMSKLIIKPLKSGKGLIVYPRGYYFGHIRNNKAEDEEGIITILEEPNRGDLGGLENGDQERIFLIIKGKWTNGDLISGKASNRQRQLFQLAWDKLYREIILNFEKDVGEILSYKGEVDISAADSLMGILTGKAIITFQDNSTYEGRVCSGRMSTNEKQVGTYRNKDGSELYRGGYRNGLRHGKSTITKDSKVSFEMEWKEGVPNTKTFEMLLQPPRQESQFLERESKQ